MSDTPRPCKRPLGTGFTFEDIKVIHCFQNVDKNVYKLK